jgi:small subunit ribosomal protein S7
VPREQRIAREVLAVLEGTSDVFKWLEERHKVATANRCVEI